MLRKLLIISIILTLTGCAGIRFCSKEESVKTGCKSWDPATTIGATAR